MERAFHLPPGWRLAERPHRFGEGSLLVAEVPAKAVAALVAELGRRADRRIDGATRRARAIARAARRFLDRGDPLRRRAIEALPTLTGFSRPMIEEALPRAFAPITETALAGEVARSRGEPVAVLGIVSAGNIPFVALPKAVLALAAGCSCVVKTAAGDPLSMVLFAEALSEVDDDLGSRLAVLWWAGGVAACEPEFLRAIDSVVAYGSNEAIRALAPAVRGCFVGHGHKLSFALVRLGHEADPRALAEAAALDVVLYDQLGCLSPQCVYTLGGATAERRAFVDRLEEALGDLDRRLPPGELPEASALAVRRLRDEYEWREIGGEAVRVRGAVGRWTLIDDPTPAFRPSPLHRTILVRRLDSLSALRGALGDWLPLIESAGMGPWPDPQAAAELASLGLPRLARLGEMQSPDLGWRQGGLAPMAGIEPGENP
jgi:acyl-CoA reductase-like NAD-dependent aldehyde dehydrogenase